MSSTSFSIYTTFNITYLTVNGDTYVLPNMLYQKIRNRWYSSELGRFISRDPIGYSAGDVNLYRFVGNNPVNGLDPMGLFQTILDYKYVKAVAYYDWYTDKNEYIGNENGPKFYLNGIDIKVTTSQKTNCESGECVKTNFKQTVIKSNIDSYCGDKPPFKDPCWSDSEYFDEDKRIDWSKVYPEAKSTFESGDGFMIDSPGRYFIPTVEKEWRARVEIICEKKDGRKESYGFFEYGFEFSSSGTRKINAPIKVSK